MGCARSVRRRRPAKTIHRETIMPDPSEQGACEVQERYGWLLFEVALARWPGCIELRLQRLNL